MPCHKENKFNRTENLFIIHHKLSFNNLLISHLLYILMSDVFCSNERWCCLITKKKSKENFFFLEFQFYIQQFTHYDTLLTMIFRCQSFAIFYLRCNTCEKSQGQKWFLRDFWLLDRFSPRFSSESTDLKFRL